MVEHKRLVKMRVEHFGMSFMFIKDIPEDFKRMAITEFEKRLVTMGYIRCGGEPRMVQQNDKEGMAMPYCYLMWAHFIFVGKRRAKTMKPIPNWYGSKYMCYLTQG
jgi:hypothetical protein